MATKTQKININTATAEEIADTVSMVGLEKARTIVAYREAKGPFAKMHDLVHVPGFQEKLVDGLSLFCDIGEGEGNEDDNEETGKRKRGTK